MTALTVVSENALIALAAGQRMNFAGSQLFRQTEQAGGVTVSVIHHVSDRPGVRLAVIRHIDGEDTTDFLARPLRAYRNQALSRMLSFFQRASQIPLRLPDGWRQFKHDNLIAFYALPTKTAPYPRWIAETHVLGGDDVAFWKVTDSESRTSLGEFQHAPERSNQLESFRAARDTWARLRQGALAALQGPSEEEVKFEMSLDGAGDSLAISQARTLDEWLPDLTSEQRKFVEASSDRSIRLRGPAGSGKTLAMAAKAVKEVLKARTDGVDIRVLFVTHSWALAGDVDELLSSLTGGLGPQEIETLPLVAVAQKLLPAGMGVDDLRLMGDDSQTSKMLQLDEIEEVLNAFLDEDWVTFRHQCSDSFAARMESEMVTDRRGLAWDCLVEFGCVLGAEGIFPGANSLARYMRVPRAPWMTPLATEGDRKVMYALYERFWDALQARGLVTSDQLLTDFLNYLETFSWNHRRQTEGYDLVFADEFHLFNIQERHTLRYLSKQVKAFPRIFMATDPRQSPWQSISDDELEVSADSTQDADEIDGLDTFDIDTVHRSTPEVLELLKDIHLQWPNLALDSELGFSLSNTQSSASSGPIPSLFIAPTQAQEETQIYRAIAEIYGTTHPGARLALAIVDEDRFARYAQFMEQVAASGKYRVVQISSRDDVGVLKRQRRGVVFGPAEYLAGLQFDTVLVAGIPPSVDHAANQGHRQRAMLSLLYLAISRATREVRIFSNDDYGGIPAVLSRAADRRAIGVFRTDG